MTRSVCVLSLVAVLGCGDGGEAVTPLAGDSPWPKFRGNAQQTGATAAAPEPGGVFWEFETGKGIFSSPVVGGDGTVYVGSADRTFYAIARDGSLRWSFETGEIIDSAALLDDAGRVIFGSGDGHVYALDAADGHELWRYAADSPDVNNAFINWFEGNIAIGPNGDLYAPNDNFFVYALDRASGEVRWRATRKDQTWSSPAVDPATGHLYIGNNNLLPALGDNLFALDADGKELWSNTIIGSIAASPLLTGADSIVVGGFDGYVRAYDTEIGIELWSYGTRDHVYASAAQLPEGTIVVPSADGTVYGLDPATGARRWGFDAREAIRSSPAVAGDGTIYFGSGEGKLFALEPDGSLRWAIQLIDDDRNDLNSSPALGRDAVYVAGENGSVFSVPYDYCLDADDERCTVGGGEALPDDGAFIQYTTSFGAPLPDPPDAIDATQALAFTLAVRSGGDTELALIDSESVQVTVTPASAVQVDVSGDRRFLTVVPLEPFVAGGDGRVAVRVEGDYLENFERQGLQMLGGERAGSFSRDFDFAVRAPGAAELPLPVPSAPGDPSAIWELYRLAAPLPAMLPSYNQIGFDSLHYLVGVVEPGLAWVVGGTLSDDGDTIVDPATAVLFPIQLDYRDGDLVLINDNGFALEVMGFALELNTFRAAARLDDAGDAPDGAVVVVSAICGDIPLYGAFVRELGLCNPQTDVLQVFGGSLLRAHDGGVQQAPAGLGDVAFEVVDGAVHARLTGTELVADEHALSVLLIDDATGRPIKRDYSRRTTVTADGQGRITDVSITTGADPPAAIRAYLMVDAYPAARATLATAGSR